MRPEVALVDFPCNESAVTKTLSECFAGTGSSVGTNDRAPDTPYSIIGKSASPSSSDSKAAYELLTSTVLLAKSPYPPPHPLAAGSLLKFDTIVLEGSSNQ